MSKTNAAIKIKWFIFTFVQHHWTCSKMECYLNWASLKWSWTVTLRMHNSFRSSLDATKIQKITRRSWMLKVAWWVYISVNAHPLVRGLACLHEVGKYLKACLWSVLLCIKCELLSVFPHSYIDWSDVNVCIFYRVPTL